VIVIHDTPADALQAHPGAVATATGVPGPPAAPIDRLSGLTE
jgi:hypothetical protein